MLYAAPFRLSEGEGPRTIEYRSVDFLGNWEVPKSTRLFLDNSPPRTEVLPATGPFGIDTNFTLTAKDKASGVHGVSYRVDQGPWRPYAGPFALPQGTHLLSYQSVDNLGNQESITTREIAVGEELHPTVEERAARQFEVNPWPFLLAGAIAVTLLLLFAVWRRRRKKKEGVENGAPFSASKSFEGEPAVPPPTLPNR